MCGAGTRRIFKKHVIFSLTSISSKYWFSTLDKNGKLFVSSIIIGTYRAQNCMHSEAPLIYTLMRAKKNLRIEWIEATRTTKKNERVFGCCCCCFSIFSAALTSPRTLTFISANELIVFISKVHCLQWMNKQFFNWKWTDAPRWAWRMA